MTQYFAFLDQIKDPLLAHMNNPEKDGVDFAEWLIGSRMDGYSFYCSIRDKAGVENLMMLFKAYPPIWNAIGNNEPRVRQFVTEFMERDQRIAAEQMEEGPAGMEPPPPSPAPVRKKKVVVV